MKDSRPVKILLSTVSHATEDPAKVSSAILNVCPEGFPRKLDISKTKGHFGNEIRVYHLESRKPSDAVLFLKNLLAHLSPSERETLLRELQEHFDTTGVLHLRLDKQEAERGVLSIQEADPVKVEVSFAQKDVKTAGFLDKVREELLTPLDKALN